MKNKRVIMLAIILVVIVAVISTIIINNQGEQQINSNNQFTNISEDTFIGTVISNDTSQVTVVPNKDELIRQSSFEIINAVISQNTVVYCDQVQAAIDDIKVGDIIKVTFDGKIYEVKPGKVIAQRLDIIPNVQSEN